MTAYTITAIERTDGSPPRPHDEEKLGKSVRIVSIKIGEPAVLAYVDDPICTLWTPEVLDIGVDTETSDIKPFDSWQSFLIREEFTVICEGITYKLQWKVGEE